MATVPIAIQSPIPVNSTTYADIVSLEGNIDRLPQEPSDQYLDRLARASVENRTHIYEGVVAEIATQLGLSIQPGISIAGPTNTVITCDLTGITLVSGTTTLLCPLVILDIDEAWSWNKLSTLVQKINSSILWTATLLAPDGAAIQICRQTNIGVGMPYEVVTSEVGLIGMLEPSLGTIAATPSGGLAYQVQEFLQAIMTTDRSYWAR